MPWQAGTRSRFGSRCPWRAEESPPWAGRQRQRAPVRACAPPLLPPLAPAPPLALGTAEVELLRQECPWVTKRRWREGLGRLRVALRRARLGVIFSLAELSRAVASGTASCHVPWESQDSVFVLDCSLPVHD